MPSGSSTLNAILTGNLDPEVTIISDSLVQPGLLLFQELVLRKLERYVHTFIENLQT